MYNWVFCIQNTCLFSRLRLLLFFSFFFATKLYTVCAISSHDRTRHFAIHSFAFHKIIVIKPIATDICTHFSLPISRHLTVCVCVWVPFEQKHVLVCLPQQSIYISFKFILWFDWSSKLFTINYFSNEWNGNNIILYSHRYRTSLRSKLIRGDSLLQFSVRICALILNVICWTCARSI